ncbi:hypothetical protein ACFE04_029698 [Oxalis oulophora]
MDNNNNSDINLVLNFLIKNGLRDSELALRHDLFEKVTDSQYDFENFVFPMIPPLPPVRIPANLRRDEEVADGCRNGSLSVVDDDDDEEDEFVSLESSTSGVCSSEFTNPYCLRTMSPTNSSASSDRLSEFGTARDYPDFDMQNEFYWYDGKDDGQFMSPSFGGTHLFGCQSEDKFIMTSDDQFENMLNSYGTSDRFQAEADVDDYLDKQCIFNKALSNDENRMTLSDHFRLDKDNNLHEDCSENIDTCCGDDVDYSFSASEETCLNDFQSKCVVEKGFPENGLDDCELHDEEVPDAHNELNAFAGDGNIIDELQMYETREDEYEVFNLRVIHRKNRTGFEANKDLPIVLNTVIASRYYVTEYLGSAAFSKVVQAHDLQTGTDVCLKIIKNDKDFFDQSLDEIKLLKLVNKYDPADRHHLLRLYDYFYHQEHLFIVCELLKANLYEFQKFNQESGSDVYFTLGRIQAITRQCLEALEYLHHLGIIHCDLKPENILIKSYKRCEIKVIDLGSSCFRSDNLCLYVQSRSYRAPEVILGLPYDERIDLWSLGCVLAELCSGEVLFPNDEVVMILSRMIGILGPIDLDMLEKGQEAHKYFTEEYDLHYINEETNQLEYIIPKESSLEYHLQVSDNGFIDFIKNLLEINPERRPTAREALEHPWLSHPY